MLFLICLFALPVVFLVTFGIILLVRYRHSRKWKYANTIRADLAEAASGGLAVLLPSVIIGIIVLMAGSVMVPDGDNIRYESGLVALQSDSSESSYHYDGFFVSTSYKDEYQVYNFLSKDSNGGYRLQEVGVNSAVVYEDSTPATASFVEVWSSKNWSAIFPWQGTNEPYTLESYEFHVPKGSVTSGTFDVGLPEK